MTVEPATVIRGCVAVLAGQLHAEVGWRASNGSAAEAVQEVLGACPADACPIVRHPRPPAPGALSRLSSHPHHGEPDGRGPGRDEAAPALAGRWAGSRGSRRRGTAGRRPGLTRTFPRRSPKRSSSHAMRSSRAAAGGTLGFVRWLPGTPPICSEAFAGSMPCWRRKGGWSAWWATAHTVEANTWQPSPPICGSARSPQGSASRWRSS
jgi:hypothetical protein